MAVPPNHFLQNIAQSPGNFRNTFAPNQANRAANEVTSAVNTPVTEHNSSLNQPMQQDSRTVQVPPTPQSHVPQQAREPNTVSLYRLGQETVQDIVSRTQEVYQTLRILHPSMGTAKSSNISNEKKAKVQELLRAIRLLFKRLRLIYDKCNENAHIQGMEYTHIESLIPFKGQSEAIHEAKKNSEAYRLAYEERMRLRELIAIRNSQLKEIIDHIRKTVREINIMLNMRKT